MAAGGTTAHPAVAPPHRAPVRTPAWGPWRPTPWERDRLGRTRGHTRAVCPPPTHSPGADHPAPNPFRVSTAPHAVRAGGGHPYRGHLYQGHHPYHPPFPPWGPGQGPRRAAAVADPDAAASPAAGPYHRSAAGAGPSAGVPALAAGRSGSPRWLRVWSGGAGHGRGHVRQLQTSPPWRLPAAAASHRKPGQRSGCGSPPGG